MEKSIEVQYCTSLLVTSGSIDRLRILKLSNLTLRERKIISLRFISGLSAKEVAYQLNMTEINYQKTQRKIFEKMYLWLKINNMIKEPPQEVIEYLKKNKI